MDTKGKLRDLDRWLAKHLMKWHLWEGYAYNKEDNTPTHYCKFPPPPAWKGCFNNYFVPTERIEPAMDVVEAMRKLGFVAGMANGLDGSWEVNFDKSGDWPGDNYAAAGTLPLAICMSAQKAVKKLK